MKSSINGTGHPLYWLCLLALLSIGCNKYYKPVPVKTSPEAVGQVIDSQAVKYFILRQGRYAYRMYGMTLDNVSMTLNGFLTKLDPNHYKYLNAKHRQYSYYNSERVVLNEIHIYSRDTFPMNITQSFSIPLSRIDKIELIEHDKGRTTGSKIVGGVIITVSVAAVIVAIAAATSNSSSSSSSSSYGGGCSCPVVSVFDGQQYVIQGELYTGAITPKIEQKDNLSLSAQPINKEIQLKISNDVNERAYTDYTYLAVVEHDQSVRIGVGTDGQFYGLADLVSPASARLNDNRDMLSLIRDKDQKVCSFDDTISASSTSELTLDFKYAGDRKYAKLVLQLKNTLWLAYIYESFTSHYGKKYGQWQDKINDMPANEINQWIRDQQIPLTVSVSTTSGWKEVTQLNMAGMLVDREMVIPLNLESDVSDPIRVKLSTGFLFWELDYAALDFTPDQQFATSILTPFVAVNELGVDVLNPLLKEDGIYFTQPDMGNDVNLKYKWVSSVQPGKSYSMVLMSKGYYELVRDYSGQPDKEFLKKFSQPGALPGLSKQTFQLVAKNTTANLPGSN